MLFKRLSGFYNTHFDGLARFFLIFLIYINYFIPMASSGQQIWKGPKFVPSITPVGIDFKVFHDYALQLWRQGIIDLTSIYPPFSTLMVSPYVIFSPLNAYRIHAFLIYICFYANLILVGKIFSSEEKPGRVLGPSLFFFLISLMGYPFLFAFERGNSDVFACFFCLLFLLNFKKGKYLLAISFLVLATQLKIYPLFFSFILLKNHTRKYFYLFVVINFALLFSLGMVGFDTLISNLMYWGDKPYVWIGNHSAHSFATFLSTWLEVHWGVLIDYKKLKLVLLAPFFLLWAWSLLEVLKKTDDVIANYRFYLNTFLFVCVITAVSHDYKLVILYPIIYIFLKWMGASLKKFTLTNVVIFIIFSFYIYCLNLPYSHIRGELFPNKYTLLILILLTSNAILFYIKKNMYLIMEHSEYVKE